METLWLVRGDYEAPGWKVLREESQAETTKQLVLAEIAGKQAGTAQEKKIKKMKGRAFSRKTGPLGLQATPILNRTSLLRG